MTGSEEEEFDELERRALEFIRKRRAARTTDIPENALVWMALAPRWTASVAQAAGFPSDGYGEARQVLQRMADKRLCIMQEQSAMVVEGSAARSVRQEPSFYMEAAAREELLQRVKNDYGRGLSFLRHQIAEAGTGVITAVQEKIGVGRPMMRWATLARLAQDDLALTGELKRTITELLAQQQSGEALRWMEAARRIEGVIGGKLTAAIEWAGRQIELFHRREDDERHLAHFFPQQELVDAFTALVSDGDDDHWALHLAGVGGVGKTMLVRYITAKWNAARNRSTARVDFDYLNPNYPSRAPGLLLTELAKDLRLNDQKGNALRLFDLLDEHADVLHERWNSELVSAPSADDALEDPTFVQILDTFAEAASQLPQPVVLLLDTCEELAKVQADGSAPDSVRMTFASLERLHDRMPSLRVVFSGRRPLAQRGAGWSCGSTRLAPRSYLRLAEVRGFSGQEANDFLEQDKIRVDLIEAILEQSREQSATSVFKWDTVPPAAEDDQERFRPFELALLAEWARAEPDTLSADMIRSSADTYVEARIVGRIVYPGLQKLIPAVALLGRFDEPTLRQAAEALGVTSKGYEAALLDLRQQEWIDVQRSGFFVVDRGLLPRLRAYYDKLGKRAGIDVFTAQVGRYLERRTLTADFAELDPAHFDAFLRLFEREGRRVARWWHSVEERFARTRQWAWAHSLTSRLLGDDGPVASAGGTGSVGRPESPIRAAVLATQAAAIIHLDPAPDVGPIWQEVAAKALRHPTKVGQRRLRIRALVGQIASQRPGTAYNAKELAVLASTVRGLAKKECGDEQLMASCLAAIEVVTDKGGSSADAAQLRRAATAIAEWTTHGTRSADLRAAAYSLVARIVRWTGADRPRPGNLDELVAEVSLGPLCEPFQGDEEEMLLWLRQAMDISRNCGPARQDWLDWRAPADTPARIRLEFIRATYPSLFPPEAVLEEVGALRDGQLRLPASVTTVDGDRLASALIQLAGFAGKLSAATLAEIRAQARMSSAFHGVCRVHDLFPPLFATLAEAMAGCGAIDEALLAMGERGRRAEQTAAALDVEHAVDRASLRIVRQMRLRDEGQGLSSSLRQSPRLDDWALLWELEGLDGPKSTLHTLFEPPRSVKIRDEDRPAWQHVRWRGVPATGRRLGRHAVDWAANTFTASRAQPDAGFGELVTLFDALEAVALGRSVGRHRTVVGVSERDRPDVVSWADRHPHEPAQALLLLLRSEALAGRATDYDDKLTRLSWRLGAHRAAQIALGEGQLLALRLPAKALPVLARAYEWFDRSDDDVGAFIAGTCRALAMCRVGCKAREFRTVMAQIEHCYNSVRNGASDAPSSREQRSPAAGPLPTWTALEAAARDPRTGLDQLGPAGWRPWLVRLAACMAWFNDLGGPRRFTTAVEEWLLAHYGGQLEDRIALPAELDGWLSGSQNSPQAFWRRAVSLAPGVAGVLLGGALVFGVIWLGNWVPYMIPVFFALFYGILGIAWAAAIYRRALSKARIKVRVRSVPSLGRSEPDQVKVTFGWKFSRWFTALINVFLLFTPYLYRRYRRWRGLNSAFVSLKRSAPYQEAALALPEPLGRFSRRLNSWLRKRPAVIDLAISRQAAWQCWEALICLGTEETRSLADLSLRFRRTVPAARKTVVSQLDKVSEVLYWADAPHTEIARRGWGALANDDHFTVRSIQATPQEVRSDLSPVRHKAQVLHIIGSAVQTASAVRLEVANSKSLVTRLGGEDETETAVRGDLLHGEELLSLFPGVTLCVLQATPVLIDKRTSADREQSGNLRQFGAELFKLGIPFVMIVPPLPVTIGAAVIYELAKVLREGHAQTVDLLNAISCAQDDLEDWSEADEQTRLEAALDLCLYAPQSEEE